MSTHTEWDVALSKAGSKKYPTYCVNLPSVVSRALVTAGMFRIRLIITDEGILLIPYVAAQNRARPASMTLPESWK